MNCSCILGDYPNGPGVCPYCSKNVQNLAYHVEDKHCPNPTPCPICGKVCDSLNKMRVHKSRNHKKTNQSQDFYWIFNKCCTFLCFFTLSKVIQSYFPGHYQNGPGVCPYCSKHVQQLAYHVEDKHVPNPTPCPICGKVYNSMNKMRVHKSTNHKTKKNISYASY